MTATSGVATPTGSLMSGTDWDVLFRRMERELVTWMFLFSVSYIGMAVLLLAFFRR